MWSCNVIRDDKITRRLLSNNSNRIIITCWWNVLLVHVITLTAVLWVVVEVPFPVSSYSLHCIKKNSNFGHRVYNCNQHSKAGCIGDVCLRCKVYRKKLRFLFNGDGLCRRIGYTLSLSLSLYIYIYIHMYSSVCVCVCMCVCVCEWKNCTAVASDNRNFGTRLFHHHTDILCWEFPVACVIRTYICCEVLTAFYHNYC
jgi:hypothetical protein